ncbi:12601_t:CDS:2 [Acaulospora colombiana]|uniref:12601_t:CDS:1 n=1 Tax=Acaulospora colombiana TaxID=27376 RepID=A0ACA9LFK3_9GLOM|nr:12601_t:CDS:2 [Acaulospora colombiana]
MSAMTFQPMVIPTTPKQTNRKFLDAENSNSIENISPSSSFNSKYGAKRYRGASVEDLQLPPAFSLPKNAPVISAIELAYDRDFSYIPHRRPVGYIDVAALKKAWEAGEIDADDQVINLTTRFDRSSKTGRPYSVITPDTPLEVLEEFLQSNVFAIGQSPKALENTLC